MATDKLVDFDHVTDYISREEAISEIMSEPTDAHYPSWYAEKLKQIPAADVVEVVRCKDCKWYMESKYTPPIRFCYRLKDSNGNPVGYNFAESDFCSYAERI